MNKLTKYLAIVFVFLVVLLGAFMSLKHPMKSGEYCVTWDEGITRDSLMINCYNSPDVNQTINCIYLIDVNNNLYVWNNLSTTDISRLKSSEDLLNIEHSEYSCLEYIRTLRG